MEKLLNVDQVAEFLAMKRAGVYALTRQNKIPHIRVGQKNYRYSQKELEKWIENGGTPKEDIHRTTALDVS